MQMNSSEAVLLDQVLSAIRESKVVLWEVAQCANDLIERINSELTLRANFHGAVRLDCESMIVIEQAHGVAAGALDLVILDNADHALRRGDDHYLAALLDLREIRVLVCTRDATQWRSFGTGHQVTSVPSGRFQSRPQ